MKYHRHRRVLHVLELPPHAERINGPRARGQGSGFIMVSFEKSSNFVNFMEQHSTIQQNRFRMSATSWRRFELGEAGPGHFEIDGEGAGGEAGVRNLLRKLCTAVHADVGRDNPKAR